ERRPLQLFIARKTQEVVTGRGHVGVGQTFEREVGPVPPGIDRPGDRCVQRLDVGEILFGCAPQRDVAVRAADRDLDASPVERRERILQADPKPADDQVGLAPLLGVFVLGQVLIAQAAAEIGDVPTVAALHDLRFSGAGQGLLVERVGDDFADRLRYAPVVENLLDVEVEEGYRPSQSQASSTVAKYATSISVTLPSRSRRWPAAVSLSCRTMLKSLRPAARTSGSHSRLARSWSARFSTRCLRQSASS